MPVPLTATPVWKAKAEWLEEYLDGPLLIRLRDEDSTYGEYEPGWYLEAALDDGLAHFQDEHLMFVELGFGDDMYEPPAEMVAVASAFNANPRRGWIQAIAAGLDDWETEMAEEVRAGAETAHALGQLRGWRTRLMKKLDPSYGEPPRPYVPGTSFFPRRRTVAGEVEVIEGFG